MTVPSVGPLVAITYKSAMDDPHRITKSKSAGDRIARAVARKFQIPKLSPEIISADLIAEELGSWARGYAIDQQVSGEKARRELGWKPLHLDPESEIISWQGY
jgi:hypothetical protein